MLGSALLGALAFAPPPAPAYSQADPPTIVLMGPERPGDYDERILATVAAHLHELDLVLVTERYAASFDLRDLVVASRPPIERSDARGILWVDVPEQPGGDLWLYVIVRDSPQIYGRVIAGDLGEAVAIETLANVAATAATALGEGRAIQLDAPAPAPEPEPAPKPKPKPTMGTITLDEGELVIVERPWLRLRAGYRGNSYARMLPWQSSVPRRASAAQ